MSRLLVVSPHLDDGVFGCGNAIAAHPGAVVVTIFAGGPPVWREPTDWDAASGFEAGEDAVARRRLEDREALAEIGAEPLWLPFWDSQYGCTPSPEDVAAALKRALSDTAAGAVYIPLGLWHSDHRLTHEAAAALIPRHPLLAWFAYEDAIYRRFADSGQEQCERRLRERGIAAERLPPGGSASDAKRRSIASYRSQLRALTTNGRPGWDDALEPEVHYRLRPLECES